MKGKLELCLEKRKREREEFEHHIISIAKVKGIFHVVLSLNELVKGISVKNTILKRQHFGAQGYFSKNT